MIPATFDYARPASLDDAIALLGKRDGAKLLAGGHSLIPMMKLRLAAPSLLVDLAGVPDLTGIRSEGGRVTIGAMTPHAELAASDELRRYAPVLWDAANQLGDPQVRNRGTIGGALAHGDPSGDYGAVARALDATFTLAGPGGVRTLKVGEFLLGMFESALRSDEVLTEISFDVAPQSAYTKYRHPASHYALVGVAAVLSLNGDTIAEARIGVTGVGDSAFRAGAVEKALIGQKATEAAAVRAACAGTAAGIEARSDVEASASYRAAMADVFASRAIKLAAERRPN